MSGYISTTVLHAAYGSPTKALQEADERQWKLEHLPRERWARNCMTLAQVLALWADGKFAGSREPGAGSRELGRRVLPSALDQGETMSLAATVEFLPWVACAEQDHEHAASLLGGVPRHSGGRWAPSCGECAR
ncbi:hypothetical protein [Streptomyces sp. NPDC057336]|uniref:hypothetical protein n=1 Tax=Streptomyces sp. NPDC057336 TaxID=3346102 RepID=UPI0036325126